MTAEHRRTDSTETSCHGARTSGLTSTPSASCNRCDEMMYSFVDLEFPQGNGNVTLFSPFISDYVNLYYGLIGALRLLFIHFCVLISEEAEMQARQVYVAAVDLSCKISLFKLFSVYLLFLLFYFFALLQFLFML